jgi:hypothetical protein
MKRKAHIYNATVFDRQKSSGAEGERLREAASINKSLSTLGLETFFSLLLKLLTYTFVFIRSNLSFQLSNHGIGRHSTWETTSCPLPGFQTNIPASSKLVKLY